MYAPPRWFGAARVRPDRRRRTSRVILCGAAGVWLAAPERAPARPAACCRSSLITGVHTLVFGHSRYHLPLIPILALYGAALLATRPRGRIASQPAGSGRCGRDRAACSSASGSVRWSSWTRPASGRCSIMSANAIPRDRRARNPTRRTSGVRNPLDPSRRIQRGAVRSRRHAVPAGAAAVADGDRAAHAAVLRIPEAPRRWQALADVPQGPGASCERPTSAARRPRHSSLAAARATRADRPPKSSGWSTSGCSRGRSSTCGCCRATGLDRLLGFLEQAGVRTGVLSDYPAESKLQALGLDGRFSPVLCSTRSGRRGAQAQPARIPARVRAWRLRAGRGADGRRSRRRRRRGRGGRRHALRHHRRRIQSQAADRGRTCVFRSLERLRRVLDDRR